MPNAPAIDDPIHPSMEATSPANLRRYARIGVISLGLAHLIAFRNAANPAGISYLDIADAYRHGDFVNAINGYWSPLYSWLLAAAMALLHPTPYWEFAVAHFVNFLIYIGALFAFERFLNVVIGSQDDDSALPDWAWIAIGYPLFAWTSLVLISTRDLSADLLAAAFMYLAASFLVILQRRVLSVAESCYFGAALGVAYLSKAGMFPLAFVFLLAALLSRREATTNIKTVFLAFVVFLAVSLPFVTALSRQKHRLTFGDAGTLNHAWFVNNVSRYAHWQGEPPGLGVPVHPDRQLSTHPLAFEYATPVSGTQPIWYDPTYWYEGMQSYVSLRNLERAVMRNLGIYAEIFVHAQIEIFGLVLLIFWSGHGRLRRFYLHLPLIAAAIAPFVMFALAAKTEARFIGGFLTIIFCATLATVRLSSAPELRRYSLVVVALVSVWLALAITASSALNLVEQRFGRRHPQYQIAQQLHALGLNPGDRVATIGPGFASYWARLARAHIVAEVPFGHEPEFWLASPAEQDVLLSKFRALNIKMVVANDVSGGGGGQGCWQPLSDGGTYVLLLQQPRARPSEHCRAVLFDTRPPELRSLR